MGIPQRSEAVVLRRVHLLLALCVRRSELLGARWAEFDLEGDLRSGPVWHLPASRTKTGKELDISLVPQVVEWLQALKVLAADGEFVFPNWRRDRRHRVAHVGLDTLNVALLRVAHGLPHFTLHDLRRTGRTHLAALGVHREAAKRCLGHKLKGVEGTYDRPTVESDETQSLFPAGKGGWAGLGTIRQPTQSIEE